MSIGAKTIELVRRHHTPGQAVQRFGDWRKGQPTVMIENKQWASLGKPEKVVVMIDGRDE